MPLSGNIPHLYRNTLLFSKLAKLICYAAVVSLGDDDYDTCCPGLKRIEIRNARVKTNVRAYKKIEPSQTCDGRMEEEHKMLCVQSLDFNSEVCPN